MITILKKNVKRRGVIIDKVKCSCGIHYYTDNLEEDYRCKKCLELDTKFRKSKRLNDRLAKKDIREYEEQVNAACEGALNE